MGLLPTCLRDDSFLAPAVLSSTSLPIYPFALYSLVNLRLKYAQPRKNCNRRFYGLILKLRVSGITCKKSPKIPAWHQRIFGGKSRDFTEKSLKIGNFNFSIYFTINILTSLKYI